MKTILFISMLSLICIPYFSQSPGGVSNNLALWFKANSGITVNGSNVVTDLNLASSSPSQTMAIFGTPVLYATGINYSPSVQFNGTITLFSQIQRMSISEFLIATTKLYC